MGRVTGIEWADASVNFWQGCHKVSEGCRNCYMYREKKRFGHDPATVVRSSDATFNKPLHWKESKKIIVCSWSDFFHDIADEWRRDALVLMDIADHHRYIIPTKRTHRMIECLYGEGGSGGYVGVNQHRENVWILASIENQNVAEERVNELLELRKYGNWPVLGLSIEPMLGEMIIPRINEIDWVICGGESGPNARPMHPDWPRSIRDQAVSAGVPFFFKQWGKWLPVEQLADDFPTCGDIPVGKYEQYDWDDYRYSLKVGKKKAGCLLDGTVWDQMPEVIHGM